MSGISCKRDVKAVVVKKGKEQGVQKVKAILVIMEKMQWWYHVHAHPATVPERLVLYETANCCTNLILTRVHQLALR